MVCGAIGPVQICLFVVLGIWLIVYAPFRLSLSTRHQEYARLYRDHYRIALALPGEPYDFGRNVARLHQILHVAQTDRLLESARQLALHERRQRRRRAVVYGVMPVVLLITTLIVTMTLCRG